MDKEELKMFIRLIQKTRKQPSQTFDLGLIVKEPKSQTEAKEIFKEIRKIVDIERVIYDEKIFDENVIDKIVEVFQKNKWVFLEIKKDIGSPLLNQLKHLANYNSFQLIDCQGKDVFVGGVDWTNQALLAVKSGDLTTSVGGHFAEVGWALILFYDYFNGKDFATESTIFKSAMKPLTAKNVNIFHSTEGKDRWADVNFRSFSKVLNPSLKEYRFDLVVLLRMAKN